VSGRWSLAPDGHTGRRVCGVSGAGVVYERLGGLDARPEFEQLSEFFEIVQHVFLPPLCEDFRFLGGDRWFVSVPGLEKALHMR